MNKYLSAILVGIVLCAPAAWADTVELPLTDDAFINGIKPDLETGTWARIVVHEFGPKYGLVRCWAKKDRHYHQGTEEKLRTTRRRS